jgi:hypothetical protein
MTTSHRISVLVGASMMIAGCATLTYDATTVNSMVSMNRPSAGVEYDRIGSFKSERRGVFVIASLLTVMDVELEQTIARELTKSGGHAIINLRIEERDGPIDILIGMAQTVLLSGIRLASTRTVAIRGDVIRFRVDPAATSALGEGCRWVSISGQPTDGAPSEAFYCSAHAVGVSVADKPAED